MGRSRSDGFEYIAYLGLLKKYGKLIHTDGSKVKYNEIGELCEKDGEQVRGMAKYLAEINPEIVVDIIDGEVKIFEEVVMKTFTELNKKCVGRKTGEEERKPKYEDMGDYYRVYAGNVNNPRVINITKEKLKLFKELYILQNLTINQICYKLDIPRRDLFVIKTAFNITKGDVPFLDEEITEDNIDNLVDQTLEKKKEQFFIKLEAKKVKEMEKELNKYRQKDYFLEKIKELNKDILETSVGPVTPREYPKNNNGRMLEVPIVDLHLNKLAWNEETGEDYDSKIATERFKETILKIKNRVIGDFERVIFPIGNDYFNIDGADNATFKGTRQDVDSRFSKMYITGTNLINWALNELSEIAPVYAFLVPGNHDATLSFCAINTVAAYFREDPFITVDINPNSRKYVWHGNNLIGFTHMDKEKKRIEGNMQQEASEAWGKTIYREWHGAHLHSEHAKETNGIIIRNLSSVTGTDLWHHDSGYVGAIARTQVFDWDREEGLWDMKYITVNRKVKSHVIIL